MYNVLLKFVTLSTVIHYYRLTSIPKYFFTRIFKLHSKTHTKILQNIWEIVKCLVVSKRKQKDTGIWKIRLQGIWIMNPKEWIEPSVFNIFRENAIWRICTKLISLHYGMLCWYIMQSTLSSCSRKHTSSVQKIKRKTY